MMFSLCINNYLVNISLIITAFLTLLLIAFPELDIWSLEEIERFNKLFEENS